MRHRDTFSTAQLITIKGLQEKSRRTGRREEEGEGGWEREGPRKKKMDRERPTIGESYNRASVPVLDGRRELRLQQQRADIHVVRYF